MAVEEEDEDREEQKKEEGDYRKHVTEVQLPSRRIDLQDDKNDTTTPRRADGEATAKGGGEMGIVDGRGRGKPNKLARGAARYHAQACWAVLWKKMKRIFF